MKNSPIIALIDMDCFYVQVELKASPEYIAKESVVVQYNSWRGGAIIAVSYEARAKGITRSMRGDEAKQKCPTLHLFSVPETRGKADLTKYRSAGAEVIKCLNKHSTRIERASIDEAYIDLTDEIDNLLVAAPDAPETKAFWQRGQHVIEGCHIAGFVSYDDWLDHIWQLREDDPFSDDVRLALGAFLTQKMRNDVFQTLGYRCSAGIGHSKVIAKYACGVHKPNQQTVVPAKSIAGLLMNAPIEKIRNLGGKMGSSVQERLNISTMGELSNFSLDELTSEFGDKTGSWLFHLCRGQDDESVLSRQLAQSIGCSKTFPGAKQLRTVQDVRHWLDQMAQEIAERIADDCAANRRLPSHLCVSYRQLRSANDQNSHTSSAGSKVVPLNALTTAAISSAAFVVLSSVNSAGHTDLIDGDWYPPLLSLGLSAGKFKPQVHKNDISKFFVKQGTPIKTPSASPINTPLTTPINTPSATPINTPSATPINTPLTTPTKTPLTTPTKTPLTTPTKTPLTTPIKIPTKIPFLIDIITPIATPINTPLTTVNENSNISFSVDPLDNSNRFSTESVSQSCFSELTMTTSHASDPIMITASQRPKLKIHDQPPVEDSIITDQPPRKKGFFAKLREQEETEPLISSYQSGAAKTDATALSSDDYIICDECSKQILVWDFPEHFDWHYARSVQKQLTQEIYEEDAKRRLETKAKKNSKVTKRKKPTLSNQLTIDNFFTR